MAPRLAGAAWLVLAVALFLIASPKARARPTEPDRNAQRIAKIVSHLLDRRHLSDLQVDDEISQRCLDKFMEMLDPRKLYLLQSDIDEFSSQKSHVDDAIRQGNVDLSKAIFDRFLTRVEERTAVAERFLEQEHDFTIDEEMVYDPDAISFAASTSESDERWRKRVKFDLLTQMADDVEPEEAIEKLHKRYQSFDLRWHQTDNDELLEYYLSALTLSFDPHSSYMSPSTLENFTIQMRLELNGIGASLESKYGETIVRRIVPGGAADKDGRLMVGDTIVGVAQGTDGEMIDIVGMKINDVVHLIRGKPGTIVRLEVDPEDKSGKKILDITRARIELKDSEARGEILMRHSQTDLAQTDLAQDGDELGPNAIAASDVAVPREDEPPEGASLAPSGTILESDPNKNGGTSYRIGVIDLPSFYMDMKGRREGRPGYKSTSHDVKTILDRFNQAKVDLVIMDLRFNGGGSLPESVDTTGLFINEGPVVQVKGPDGVVQPYQDEDPGNIWKGPLVVLINKFSASASEIFAGAIQDYGRGIILGDHSTHGKGTVQQLIDLGPSLFQFNAPNLGALKLTIQQFYRPSGDSTQNRGVMADVELPSRITHWEEIGESSLDYALKFDRVDPLPHAHYHLADDSLVKELQRRSETRRKTSEFFLGELQKIERFIQRQKDPAVTLNREKYLAQRDQENTEKEQADLFNERQKEDRPVFADTPYNDEVIAIALDYLQLLRDGRVVSLP